MLTDDGVGDSKMQAQLRRKRIPSPIKTPPEVDRRRVADAVSDADGCVAHAALRYCQRQPEVNNGVENDVISGETAQRKYVGVRPRAVIKIV